METLLDGWGQWLGWPGIGGLLVAFVLLLGAGWAVWRYRTARRQARELAAGVGAETPTPAQLAALLQQLGTRSGRQAAVESLVAAGDAGLAQLAEVFARDTDEQCLRSMAQVCVRLNTPAARLVLLAVAQTENLPARQAALRALGSYASELADVPVFRRLVEEEMQLAQHLLHGIAAAGHDDELRPALRYELGTCRQRLFGLLLQLYDRPLVLDAQQALAHPSADHQRAALALLDELIPRPLHRGLQALLDANRLPHQLEVFDDLLSSVAAAETVTTTVVRRGTAAFTPWTVGVALRQWHPQPANVALLHPHLYAANPLIRESALAVVHRLLVQRPAAYDHLLTLYPAVAELLMTPPDASNACISAQARVQLLKGTALFAETPETVLGTIVPIMREVGFQPAEEIFAKGALGASLFIICTGEVGIFNGPQLLATFGPGDFFGELALLDAEPRSASAIAQSAVTVFRLDQEDFYEVMGERSEVLRNILKVLCHRLRKQNEHAAAAK